MLSEREIFLMKGAFNAGTYYESLEEWLNEPITEDGLIVVQHLVHDADRLFTNITFKPIECMWCPKGYVDGDKCLVCEDRPVTT